MPRQEQTARLMALHKALIEAERRQHEKALGRLSDGEFLDALVKDPAFAWLQPLTRLIAELGEPSPDDDAAADARRIRALLGPHSPDTEFARRYAMYLQESAEVLVAHGAVMKELA